jgi:hypothetical protein
VNVTYLKVGVASRTNATRGHAMTDDEAATAHTPQPPPAQAPPQLTNEQFTHLAGYGVRQDVRA